MRYHLQMGNRGGEGENNRKGNTLYRQNIIKNKFSKG